MPVAVRVQGWSVAEREGVSATRSNPLKNLIVFEIFVKQLGPVIGPFCGLQNQALILNVFP